MFRKTKTKPKVSEKRGNWSEFHSERNYLLQNWYFTMDGKVVEGEHDNSWTTGPTLAITLSLLNNRLRVAYQTLLKHNELTRFSDFNLNCRWSASLYNSKTEQKTLEFFPLAVKQRLNSMLRFVEK